MPATRSARGRLDLLPSSVPPCTPHEPSSQLTPMNSETRWLMLCADDRACCHAEPHPHDLLRHGAVRLVLQPQHRLPLERVPRGACEGGYRSGARIRHEGCVFGQLQWLTGHLYQGWHGARRRPLIRHQQAILERGAPQFAPLGLIPVVAGVPNTEEVESSRCTVRERVTKMHAFGRGVVSGAMFQVRNQKRIDLCTSALRYRFQNVTTQTTVVVFETRHHARSVCRPNRAAALTADICLNQSPDRPPQPSFLESHIPRRRRWAQLMSP